MFGAGGGTSSYREMEETDVILLWGSNARETHPIIFHHLLKGVRNGARLYAIDPRRTTSAQWADRWLGLDVGSDIALSNAMAREIIHAGLVNRPFVERATEGFDEYAASVEPFTLAEGERLTGVPAEVIGETAHAFARADRAMICWTLGITEHANAVDNVLALINLALLTGHVGRYGSGLNPLRGQNNVQGGGDMGAIPNKLPGFQDVERDDEARARFEAAYGASVPPHYGWHLTQMFHAMERGELRTLYVIGENPAQSEADVNRTRRLLAGLDLLVVQDIVMTRTAEMADVVLPGDRVVVRGRGHGDEQRAARAARPQGARPARRGARRHVDPLRARAPARPRLGSSRPPRRPGTSCARSRRCTRGCATTGSTRTAGCGGRARTRSTPARSSSTSGSGRSRVEGPRAPFSVVEAEAAVRGARRRVPDPPHDGSPARVVQHRRADESLPLAAPPRRGARALARGRRAARGERGRDRARLVAARLRRGAGAGRSDSLRAGLAFMSFHFPDEVDVNQLTIDATDPKSGTAEFKAAAIRVDRLEPAEREAGESVREPAEARG